MHKYLLSTNVLLVPIVHTCTPTCDCVLQYSTQGFHPDKWQDLTTTLDGPEVAIFKEACKKNEVRHRLAAADKPCTRH